MPVHWPLVLKSCHVPVGSLGGSSVHPQAGMGRLGERWVEEQQVWLLGCCLRTEYIVCSCVWLVGGESSPARQCWANFISRSKGSPMKCRSNRDLCMQTLVTVVPVFAEYHELTVCFALVIRNVCWKIYCV